jgi:sodium/pantothenate symporter
MANNMTLYLVVVLASIIVYIVVGLVVGKKVSSTADYYVSGRNAPTILIAGTLFASMLSTNGFMADTAWAHGGAIVNAVTLNALCGVGYVVGVLFFGRYLRRSENLTMPEYFGKRFNSKGVQRFAGIVVVISITCYLLAVVIGVGKLIHTLTGLELLPAYIIAWACFTSFTFYSGSKGVIITDTMMFLLFLAATCIAAPWFFGNAEGGLGGLIEGIWYGSAGDGGTFGEAGYVSWHGVVAGYDPAAGIQASGKWDAFAYGIIYGIMWLIVVGISPWQAGRNMMAKSEHVSMRSSTIACILTTVFLTFLYMMVVSLLNVPGSAEGIEAMGGYEYELIWGFTNLVPPILGALALAGIMAAGLSSASTFLSVVGFSISNDIFNIKYKDDKDQLKKSRIIMLIISVVALLMALGLEQGIRQFTFLASTLIAASWCVIAFGSVWSKKFNAKGALWSMIAGFAGYVITKGMANFGIAPGISGHFANFLDPLLIGIYVSLIFAFIGTKLSVKTQIEDEMQAQMHVVPKSILSRKEYKRTFVYANLLIVFGVVVTVVLIACWAVPVMQLSAAS